jgi:hypothetical protein
MGQGKNILCRLALEAQKIIKFNNLQLGFLASKM